MTIFVSNIENNWSYNYFDLDFIKDLILLTDTEVKLLLYRESLPRVFQHWSEVYIFH